VRRVALLTTVCVLVTIAAACRHDGRTLREPRPDQTQSISTLAPVTDPAVIDGNTDDLAASTTGATLPLSDAEFTVTAPWTDGGEIPADNTCDGANQSPAISWTAAPEGTLEIAVTLEDTDNPGFAHWAMAGLDAGLVGLAQGEVPLGAVQATNGVGDIGYTGPCPPAGSKHTYVLTVHYLGQQTELTDGADVSEFTSGITTAEIASATVSGSYSRG
jgi:Raf kinase inhibitor-like YbhB/YbcL family protein